jgi:hypothetical protein
MLFLVIGSAVWFTFDVLYIPPRYWLGVIAICDVVVAGILVALVGRLAARPSPSVSWAWLCSTGPRRTG